MQDELTLKDLILGLRDYFRYFTRKWFWFVIGGGLMAVLFGLNAHFTPVNYIAPLTFIISDGKDSGLGIGGVLGKIGLGEEEGGGDAFRILELVKTREVLKSVLFDSITVENKSQFVADHLIEQYKYHDLWSESPNLKDFRFGANIPGKDDLYANSALKQLMRLLVGPPEDNALLSVAIDEKSGMYSFNMSTLKPELSNAMVLKVYERLTEFYTRIVTSSKRETFQNISAKGDSVLKALKIAEANLAKEKDKASSVYLAAGSLKERRLNREVLILSSLYAEVVKNREASSFLLLNEKPSFETIDLPLFPLLATGGDLKRGVLIGGILGVLLVGLVLFFRKLIKDAMV